MFKINASQLRNELGSDLYNVFGVKAEKIYAKDVISAIEQYMSNSISLQDLLDWVNIIWFTDLYEYNPAEEETIASVMAVLETMDEDDVNISDEELLRMINNLNSNIAYDEAL